MRFARLFRGRENCYGVYRVTEERSDGKQKGRGQTIRAPLTEQQYADHLAGTIRLGVIPIRDDSTVNWFAGDIDQYGIDLAELETKVQAAGFPVVVCKSKSGGAHLYCFLREPVAASAVIPVMRGWVSALGYPKSEIFPKQDRVDDGMMGNWINLPYHNEADPDAYALGLNGERLTREQFEQLAAARAASADDLAEFARKPRANGAKHPLADAPPCVATMYENKISEGGRNQALTHVGIYLKMSDEDNWKEKLMEWNYRVVEPPLPAEEVRTIARNLGRKKYEYMCKQEPMCSVCDRDTCLTRKWGVGQQRGVDYPDEDIDRIVHIMSDPAVFLVHIGGHIVDMNVDTLMSVTRFNNRVMERTGKILPTLKQERHRQRLMFIKMDREAAPDEVSDEGAVLDALQEWIGSQAPNVKEVGQVLRGYPFYDRERKAVVFKPMHFIDQYRKSRRQVEPNKIWAALRNQGATKTTMRLDGQPTNVWIYPIAEPWFTTPGEENF